VGQIMCDLTNLPEAQRELVVSSNSKILTVRGKLKDGGVLGQPVFHLTDVRLADTSNWPKP
jgi:hypothetical protein